MKYAKVKVQMEWNEHGIKIRMPEQTHIPAHFVGYSNLYKHLPRKKKKQFKKNLEHHVKSLIQASIKKVVEQEESDILYGTSDKKPIGIF